VHWGLRTPVRTLQQCKQNCCAAPGKHLRRGTMMDTTSMHRAVAVSTVTHGSLQRPSLVAPLAAQQVCKGQSSVLCMQLNPSDVSAQHLLDSSGLQLSDITILKLVFMIAICLHMSGGQVVFRLLGKKIPDSQPGFGGTCRIWH
jgi:hypothetical protein